MPAAKDQSSLANHTPWTLASPFATRMDAARCSSVDPMVHCCHMFTTMRSAEVSAPYMIGSQHH